MTTAFVPASDSRCVVLVRHGETEWSSTGRHTSTTDVELTETGRAQARRVGEALGAHRFSTVLTSPRTRARTTAALAGFGGAEVVDDLVEWDYGDLEGRTTDELSAQIGHPWSLWTATAPDPAPAESAAQVGERADRVIGRLRDRTDGDAIVFAHAHLLRVLAARWVGLPAVDGQRLALATGSISELGLEHDNPVIARWNMHP